MHHGVNRLVVHQPEEPGLPRRSGFGIARYQGYPLWLPIRRAAGRAEEVAGTRDRGRSAGPERAGSGRRMVRGLVTLQLRGNAGASPSTPPPHLAGPASSGAPGNCERRGPTSRWNPRGVGGAGRGMARRVSCPGPETARFPEASPSTTGALSPPGAATTLDLCEPWRTSAVNSSPSTGDNGPTSPDRPWRPAPPEASEERGHDGTGRRGGRSRERSRRVGTGAGTWQVA